MRFKGLIKIILLVIICSLCFNAGFTVRAEGDDSGYSEEEKEAAKAWLSAHGYPPTRAGAEMAYQDYLNGKFDDDPEVKKYREETEGDDDESETTESDTESSEEENTTEEKKESKQQGSTSENIIVASGNGTNKAVTSTGTTVNDKNTQDSIDNKLKNDDLKLSDPSEVQLIMAEEENFEQPKQFKISDIMLVTSAFLALILIAFAIKAGNKKKIDSEESENIDNEL